MLDLTVLTELGRQRQRVVARDVALCRHVRSPRFVIGRILVALGALVVCIGMALNDEPEREPETTVA